jgi:2-polyprenyl-3-methyl-5-hydroxy-6-metoxy-1,4-benzoquinol methylase
MVGRKDMLFKNSPEKFWNLIASRYAASPVPDRPAYETKIQKIKTWLTPETVVLDIGCGTGTQCGDIADSVKQVTGIDTSRKLLAIAEQRKAGRKLDNVEFVQTSVFDERFQSGSFDVVMAFYVLHFVEDIDAVFERIHDLLKPDGLFISETACLGEKSELTGRLLRFLGQLGLLPKMNLLTTRELEQALDQAGFRIVDKTRFGDPNKEFTLIAKKTS